MRQMMYNVDLQYGPFCKIHTLQALLLLQGNAFEKMAVQ